MSGKVASELAYGALVLLIFTALAWGISRYRGKRIGDVFRRDGERLIDTAKVVTVALLLLGFAVVMVINNR